MAERDADGKFAGKEKDKKEEDFKATVKDLDERQVWLDNREKDLEKREKALPPAAAGGLQEKRPISKAGQRLIDGACEAYGIDKKYVLGSNYYPETGEAVIVTSGGAKVRFKTDDEVEKLPPERVDGVSRKKPRYVAGKKKK